MYLYRIETDKDKNLNNFEKLEKIIKKAPLASTNSERLKQELENIKEFGTATAFFNSYEIKETARNKNSVILWMFALFVHCLYIGYYQN